MILEVVGSIPIVLPPWWFYCRVCSWAYYRLPFFCGLVEQYLIETDLGHVFTFHFAALLLVFLALRPASVIVG